MAELWAGFEAAECTYACTDNVGEAVSGEVWHLAMARRRRVEGWGRTARA